MSYTIKQTSVILTCEQFRDIITVFEAIRDSPDTGNVPEFIASDALRWLQIQGLLNYVDYEYGGGPDILPWEREVADETAEPLPAQPPA